MRVTVAGLDPLVGQGLEMRFSLKLRVQNPNDAPIDYDGISVALDLNGTPFASGVSDRSGTVPRFGEAVLDVPVSVSARRRAAGVEPARRGRERRAAVCAARPARGRRARHRALQRCWHAAPARDAGVGRLNPASTAARRGPAPRFAARAKRGMV